jgi:hypothetical protein
MMYSCSLRKIMKRFQREANYTCRERENPILSIIFFDLVVFDEEFSYSSCSFPLK